MSIISIILAFAAAIAVFSGYMLLMRQSAQKERMQGRIEKLSTYVENPIKAKEDADTLSGFALMLDGIVRATGIDWETFRNAHQMRLGRAGIITANQIVTLLFMKRIGLPILGTLIVVYIILAYLNPQTGGLMKLAYLILGACFVLFTVRGTDIYLKNETDKRKQLLMRAFPDTLDLLLVCVESGLALDGALARVCRELDRAYPEITEELNRTRYELTLLSDRVTALQNLAERTDLVAFRSLVSALIQSEKFGTSLSDTLRVMSLDYRQQRLLLAENKANRLPALMTIPMILLMMPAFVIIVIGPPIIRVMALPSFFGQ